MTSAIACVLMAITSEDRVATAYRVALPKVQSLCQKAGLKYPVRRVFLRAFKLEKELEIWGSPDGRKPLRQIATFPIAAMSGELGPKRKEGDYQVPEGLYRIDRFNPMSRFLLSLGLDYPNSSDRKRSDPERPGGDIFIHGSNVSIGCMAMTDPAIQQIYLLCLDAKNAGQTEIPVHIFPFRFEKAWPPSTHEGFWKELRPFYDSFEKTRFVPRFRIDEKGRYLPQR